MTYQEACREVANMRTWGKARGWELITHFTQTKVTVTLVKPGVEHIVWCSFDREKRRQRFVWSGFFMSTWDGSDEALKDQDGLPYGWCWKLGPGTDLSALLCDDITPRLVDLHLISTKEKR